MRFKALGILLLGTIALMDGAAAQTTPAPAAVRTVIATTKLPTVTDTPLYFKVASVMLPSGAKSHISGANGILYQVSGSSEVVIDGETKTIAAGEGLYIPAGKVAGIAAVGAASSNLLRFSLSPANALDQPDAAAPAVVKEMYRTVAPIPDLKAGAYDLNLTRVTFPAQMPSNPPHHRSGAAVYYILSGTGANTIAGQTVSKAPGAFIYEPYRVVHQWGNPGTEPLTFVAFNINPDGVAAVLQGEIEK